MLIWSERSWDKDSRQIYSSLNDKKAVPAFDWQPVVHVIFGGSEPSLAKSCLGDHFKNLFKTLHTEIKEWKLC